jgi:hypothetical protein
MFMKSMLSYFDESREVDHTINYPHKSESIPCREQIRALARQTSSATRLVDAIFATVADIEDTKAKQKAK